MSYRYSGVTTRLLDRDERLIDTEEPTPLVIERRGSSGSLGFIREFLSSNSSEIVMDIATHGAVLLRGFDLRSPQISRLPPFLFRDFKESTNA